MIGLQRYQRTPAERCVFTEGLLERSIRQLNQQTINSWTILHHSKAEGRFQTGSKNVLMNEPGESAKSFFASAWLCFCSLLSLSVIIP